MNKKLLTIAAGLGIAALSYDLGTKNSALSVQAQPVVAVIQRGDMVLLDDDNWVVHVEPENVFTFGNAADKYHGSYSCATEVGALAAVKQVLSAHVFIEYSGLTEGGPVLCSSNTNYVMEKDEFLRLANLPMERKEQLLFKREIGMIENGRGPDYINLNGLRIDRNDRATSLSRREINVVNSRHPPIAYYNSSRDLFQPLEHCTVEEDMEMKAIGFTHDQKVVVSYESMPKSKHDCPRGVEEIMEPLLFTSLRGTLKNR